MTLNVNVLYARLLCVCVRERDRIRPHPAASIRNIRGCPRVQNGDRVNWRTVIGLPEFSLIQGISFVLSVFRPSRLIGWLFLLLLVYEIMGDSQVSTGLHSVNSSSSIRIFFLWNIHCLPFDFTFTLHSQSH